MSHEDKRKAPRINRRAAVQFIADGKSHYGVVLNFSEIGLFIQTEHMQPPNATISVPIKVGGKKVVELHGRVAWAHYGIPKTKGVSSHCGMGIELAAAPEEYIRFVQKAREHFEKLPRGIEERFEVYHRVRFKSGEEFLTQYTENLSRGGMFLATKETLPSGASIKAQLEIPGIEEAIEVEGKVAYQLGEEEAENTGRSSGVGIQFVNLTDEATARLHHYIQRLEIHRSRPERRLGKNIPNKGTLTHYLVPELLLGLMEKHATGTLLLNINNVHKLIYVKNGQPVFVESNLRSESLGRFLVQRGVITTEDLEQSLEDLAKSEIHHGEIMVAGGLMDPTKMASNLVDHQEEKILNTFAWFEGEFEFIPGMDWPPNIMIVPIRTYRMLFQGIFRWYDAPLLSAWMGLEPASALRRVRVPSSDVSVPPMIYRMLNHLSRPQTLEQISAKLGLEMNQVIQAAYCLIIAGWATLDFSSRVEAATPTAPEKKPEIEKNRQYDVLRRWVSEDLERLRRLDFFELLGVTPSADETEITRAYMERAQRYEAQDVEEIGDEDVRSKIVQIRSWLTLAYDTLRDPNLRRVYSRKGKELRTPSDVEGVDCERVILASIRDIERGNIEKAIDGLETVRAKYPDDPSIGGYLGWALFQKDRKANLQRAAEMLTRAMVQDPTDAQIRYYLGEIYSYQSDWKKAARLFAQAVNLNPNFVKASAAYELAKSRSA